MAPLVMSSVLMHEHHILNETSLNRNIQKATLYTVELMWPQVL